MENHPIPQDVTGFQFKLLGNMTIKQFAYLAVGIVFAWVLLQLPVNILIKFPFCAFSAAFGAGLAFLPVGGRPMDSMIGNYIKALIRPTQLIYEKTGGQIYFPNNAAFPPTKSVARYNNDLNPLPKDKLKTYLESLSIQPKNAADEKEDDFLMSISGLAAKPSLYQESAAPSPNLAQTNFRPNPVPPTAQPLTSLNKKTNILNIPDSPNLITGVTKDPRGNALSNILVEIRDKDNNPIRAFKTNEFGKFASATPLVNGTYVIEFEDPKGQNKFEKITADVAGQIIMPIEAISIDMREQLRRSLFSVN